MSKLKDLLKRAEGMSESNFDLSKYTNGKDDETAALKLKERYEQLKKEIGEISKDLSKLEGARMTALFKLGGLGSNINPETAGNDRLNTEIEDCSNEIEKIDRALEPLYKKKEPLVEELRAIEKATNELVNKNAEKLGISPLSYVSKYQLHLD